jgi:hypothetical protein
VKYEDVGVQFLVQPDATEKKCGRLSNLNFIYYLQKNFSFLICRKYATVLLETDFLKNAKIYYLKHHKFENGGWTSELLCGLFISVYKRRIKIKSFG